MKYLFFSDYLAYGKCSMNRSDVLLRNDSDKSINRDFRFCLPVQGVWVLSLVRKLRPHMPQSQNNLYVNQKQYCNKFNKDFKTGPHQKKSSEKVICRGSTTFNRYKNKQ